MQVTKGFEKSTPPALCTTCGIPLDSEYFDESGIEEIPPQGKGIVLARFELPPQYCGVLEYFSQFTDQHARDGSQVKTPELQWLLLSNNRPLYPYLKLDRIVNPWGFGSFPVAIRLDENATIEFVVRLVSNRAPGNIRQVGGRIVGRYWYNTTYGNIVRRNF